MTVNPIPTRAEVTDVYTAVTMGADSLMVSGETAVGKHPVDVIRWLNDIAFEAERNQNLRVKGKSLDIYDKFAEGVVMMSELIDAKLVAITTTGKTPMRLARFRPKSEILAACESEFVFKKLQLTYGVMPVLLNSIKNDQQVVQELKALKFLKAGEKIIVTRSLKQGVTDAIKILEVQ
jgi:Pyruvate kinase